MIIVAIIVGIIIIGLISLINHISSDGSGNMDVGVFFGVFLSIFCVIEIGIVSNMIEELKPTPMDVYQGKTTLEYTIRDGEVIDSVVVFKNSVYGK
jgi:amino acid transporter